MGLGPCPASGLGRDSNLYLLVLPLILYSIFWAFQQYFFYCVSADLPFRCFFKITNVLFNLEFAHPCNCRFLLLPPFLHIFPTSIGCYTNVLPWFPPPTLPHVFFIWPLASALLKSVYNNLVSFGCIFITFIILSSLQLLHAMEPITT